MRCSKKKTQTTVVVCAFLMEEETIAMLLEERITGLRIRQLLVKSVSTQVCKPIFFFCFVDFPNDLLAL